MRPTRAEIDLGAIRHNVTTLKALVQPARLLAVVKADAYGHGAVPVARAVLDAGADILGVALVEEGVELREAGVTAPILVLSEPHPSSMDDLVRAGLAATAYSQEGIRALEAAASSIGTEVDVHLKIDTGMHRVGAMPADAVSLAQRIDRAPHLRLAAVMTHYAVADELTDASVAYTAEQGARFAGVLDELERAGVRPSLAHSANSGATLAGVGRSGLVRCGVVVYGLAPNATPEGVSHFESFGLRPALRLVSEVSFVKTVPAGTPVSYGLRYTTPAGTVLATVPIGYADGVSRRLSAVGGEVLIGGRRRPIAGSVTMDQIVVDCGPDAEVAVGDEVVLLGRQGDDEITAAEWARKLDTITYEVTTRLGPRLRRDYHD